MLNFVKICPKLLKVRLERSVISVQLLLEIRLFLWRRVKPHGSVAMRFGKFNGIKKRLTTKARSARFIEIRISIFHPASWVVKSFYISRGIICPKTRSGFFSFAVFKVFYLLLTFLCSSTIPRSKYSCFPFWMWQSRPQALYTLFENEILSWKGGWNYDWKG